MRERNRESEQYRTCNVRVLPGLDYLVSGQCHEAARENIDAVPDGGQYLEVRLIRIDHVAVEPFSAQLRRLFTEEYVRPETEQVHKPALHRRCFRNRDRKGVQCELLVVRIKRPQLQAVRESAVKDVLIRSIDIESQVYRIEESHETVVFHVLVFLLDHKLFHLHLSSGLLSFELFYPPHQLFVLFAVLLDHSLELLDLLLRALSK